jgi:hypothetical protein
MKDFLFKEVKSLWKATLGVVATVIILGALVTIYPPVQHVVLKIGDFLYATDNKYSNLNLFGQFGLLMGIVEGVGLIIISFFLWKRFRNKK